MIVILMGVSGSGKTTVGRGLAAELGWTFHEGDEYHSPASVAKMSQGIALTDEDRRPWLLALRRLIENCLQRGEDAVIACSALKEAYRAVLKGEDERIVFVYLKAAPQRIAHRLERRAGHFAGANLLGSQLATLEEPGPGEALAVDTSGTPQEAVAEILARLGL